MVKTKSFQFLLPLLLLGQVSITLALKCHECRAIRDCLNPKVCNNQTDYCLNTWQSLPDKKIWVIKSCAYTCPPAKEEYGTSPASCCRTDLCNSALTICLNGLLLITCLLVGASRALS